MSLATRVRAVLSGWWPGTASLPWLGERLAAGGATLPAAPAANAATALGLTAVYRACSLLSDAASTAPPALHRRQTNGGRLVELDTAVARTLATLAQSDAELFAFSTALTGNGYLRIVRDGTGAPFELRAIPPWRVQVEVEQGSRAVWYRVAADSTIEEAEVMLPERDVCHAKFKTIGATRLMGVPPIASCAPAFALALQSREVVRTLFCNLASPSGVLQTANKMQPDTAKALQAAWEQNFRAGGLGRVAVLANGIEFQPLLWKAVDAQLFEQMQASTLDVARAYGIPRQFLEDGQHITYASAAEGTRALYSLALRGFCARLAGALALRLLSRNERAAGASIEYDLSSVLILPGAEMAEFLSKLANAGLATPNELRNTYLNLPDVEGGDVLRAPVNTAPIDRWAAGEVKAAPAATEGEPA